MRCYHQKSPTGRRFSAGVGLCLYHQTAVKVYEFTATVDRMKTLFIGICQARIGKYDVLSAVACVGLLRKVGRAGYCAGLENQ